LTALDLAVAENRQGRVYIASIFVEALPGALALLRAQMLVCSEVFDEATDLWAWSGYAAAFDALPLGAAAPLYAADVITLAGSPLAVNFRRL
jgi:hypothetical protein